MYPEIKKGEGPAGNRQDWCQAPGVERKILVNIWQRNTSKMGSNAFDSVPGAEMATQKNQHDTT